MDTAGLAKELAIFLAPFLPYLLKVGEKALEGASDKLGADAWDCAKGIWKKIQTKAKKDPNALKSAEDLSKSPQDMRIQSDLALHIKIFLDEDQNFAMEVNQLWDEAKNLGINLTTFKGDVIASTIFTGNVIFQTFNQAPFPLSNHIRIWEFQTLIEERTKDFVGRDFIFQAINNLLDNRAFPSGYIVIRGEPGIGKTALISQLVKNKGYVHHFNIASQNIRSPKDFLANICAQLIVRYRLDYSEIQPGALEDGGFLLGLLSEAASRNENRPLVILVDALDEAEDISIPPEANHLYLPRALPDGVFFIVTTREKYDFRLLVDHRRDIHLKEDDPQNMQDIRQFIKNFIREQQNFLSKRIVQWGVDEDKFIEIIAEKSEGNFMYLVHVLSDIKENRITPTNIDNIRDLPKGLIAYYQRHWRSMRDQDSDKFERLYEPVVCFLATAQEPVTIGELAEWTKIKPIRILEVIREWHEFLNKIDIGDEPRYRIYHNSFREFLMDEVGLARYHDQISLRALDKIPGFDHGSTENTPLQ